MQRQGWHPISTYDELETKPRYAVFLFPAIQTEGYAVPEEIKTIRDFSLRECTHWHPIQDPKILYAKDIPKAPIKALTDNQFAILLLLANGKVDFHAVIKAGANLSTMSGLVKSHLATVTQAAGVKQWEITDLGLTVLHATQTAKSGTM